jgi:hypothetical protein
MSINGYVKGLLADELRWKTRLSEDAILKIIESFTERLEMRRHVIVPTYLTDDMYDAARESVIGIDFNTASKIYRSAVNEYGKKDALIVDEDEPGSFW